MKDKNIIIKTMQKEYLLQEKIFKNVIKALKSDEYIECSRNHVVNINGIQEIRSDSLVFINNDIFPVSRRRYKPLLNAFNNSIIKEAGN